MTAIHLQESSASARPSRQGAALDALNDMTRWVLATLRTWHRRSRERDELGRLNDRMLQDIGLTNAEREYLANKPFWRE